MSTSLKPAWSGPSKKISSWVRPGVCEVRARLLRPVNALMREDLPTLERPAKATSMAPIGGSVSIEGAAHLNCQSPAKSLRPCSISFASMSAVMRSVPGPPHGEERGTRVSNHEAAVWPHPSRRALMRAPQDEGHHLYVFDSAFFQ